jgi:hypothetical protein
MIQNTHQDILQKLSLLCELSPDVRFGQLVAHLGFLAEDMGMRGLGDIEDGEFLGVLEHHRAELLRRESQLAESTLRPTAP